jgi:prepilin-type processing-associated H-X9-DG protein
LRDPQISLITPYISKVVEIFRCPADPRRGAYSGTNPQMKGQIVGAARSISLNQGVGTVDPAYDEEPLPDNHDGVPDLSVNGPWLDGRRTHHRNSPYATYGKTSEFGRLGVGTSQIFLTVDESPWSINDAAFAVSAAIPEWVDWPATFHDNACGFSFCDGHAEIHKWITGSLFLDAKAKIKVITADNADWNWLAAHSTVKLY